MVQYLFLGLQYDNKYEESYLKLSRKGLSAASNTFQWNLCDGLIECLNHNLEILTALPVGCYPKHFRKVHLNDSTWEYSHVLVTELGSWNLPVVKQITRERKCFSRVLEWIDKSPDSRHVVILYSLYLPYLKALRKIKQARPTTEFVLIVPDLPGKWGILPQNRIKARVTEYLGYKALRLGSTFDKFVLLTEQMAEPMNVGTKPYVVVEGICNTQPNALSDNVTSTEKYFLYTGSLNREFGIVDLMDAFELVNSDQVELWICGAGTSENEVKERAAKNSRIRYLGFRTKAEVSEMQKNALALINPRPATGIYTQYSFPSKTIEYMASGTPVIMRKLPGIPDEYDPYLIYPQDSSVGALTDALISVLDMDEEQRKDLGQRAHTFICNEKNSIAQAQRIIKMIDEMM